MTAYPLVGFLVFVWSRSKLRGVKNHRCASLMLGNTGGMTIAVVLEHAQDTTLFGLRTNHQSNKTGGILTYEPKRIISIYRWNLLFAPDRNSTTFFPFLDLQNLQEQDAIGLQVRLYPELRSTTLETRSDYFTQCFLPLATNALEHAYRGERGQLDLDARIDEDKQHVVVTIEDQGRGIDPTVLPRLFTKGGTSKKDTKSPHGIGLHAVDAFVKALGGTIRHVPKQAPGAKFELTIPYQTKVDNFYYRQ